MSTSQRPSRTCPGLGLRRFPPKRAAPSRRHSTSFRLEKGRCGEDSGSYCTARKGVVSGTSVSVRVDLGGRRIFKNNNVSPSLKPRQSQTQPTTIHTLHCT